MKKLIYISILLLLTNSLSAQKNWYIPGTIAKEGDVEYEVFDRRVGDKSLLHILKNPANKLYKEKDSNANMPLHMYMVDMDIFKATIKWAFAPELEQLKPGDESYIQCNFYLNNKAEIVEIVFLIDTESKVLHSVSPSRYRALENMLKTSIKFKFYESSLERGIDKIIDYRISGNGGFLFRFK